MGKRLRSAFVLIVVGLSACTTFGAEGGSNDGGAGDAGGDASSADSGVDAGSCVAPTCAGRESLCKSFDFAGPCPKELEIGGNAPPVPPPVRCDGMLRFLVRNTDDATATLSLTPRLASRAHVTFVASVNDWIGPANGPEPRLVDVASNGTLATIRASTRTEKVVLELCEVTNTKCTTAAPKLERNERFVIELVVEPDGASRLLLNCVEVATARAPTGAVVDADFRVTFGAPDGQPLDGAFDDLRIWFEPL